MALGAGEGVLLDCHDKCCLTNRFTKKFARHFAVSGALTSMPIFLVSTGLRTLDGDGVTKIYGRILFWGKQLDEIFLGSRKIGGIVMFNV